MPGAYSPNPSTVAARIVANAAIQPERRPTRPCGISAPSRIAVTGETRVARTAGERPDSTVTMMPTASETTIVRVANTVPVSGSSTPLAANTLDSPLASSRPTPRPISEATVPITSDSVSTDRSTWRRLAPSARSSASSRERWATVMDSVL